MKRTANLAPSDKANWETLKGAQKIRSVWYQQLFNKERLDQIDERVAQQQIQSIVDKLKVSSNIGRICDDEIIKRTRGLNSSRP